MNFKKFLNYGLYNSNYYKAFVVFVHVAISSVMSSDIPFNYPNGDNYTAPKNFGKFHPSTDSLNRKNYFFFKNIN